MKYCSKRHSSPDDAIFCAECGEKLSPNPVKERPCPKCGQKNPKEALFCHECGATMDVTPPKPKPKPAPTPVPSPSPIPTPPNSEAWNDLSGMLLISILLGGIAYITDLDFLKVFALVGFISTLIGVINKILK